MPLSFTSPQWLSLPLVLALLTARPVTAQTLVGHEPDSQGGTVGSEPLDYAEEMPHFVGGEKAMLAFFQKRLTYSSEALAHLRAGIIYVRFVVDAQGRILDPHLIKGAGYGLDEEALRLVRLMPW